jgi:hypothetical protein
VISDVAYPRGGALDPLAGFALARHVKATQWDVPVLLQSTEARAEQEAAAAGALFLWKESATLAHDFRRLLRDYFSFGDFVFRLPSGGEVGRAVDLRSLEEQLRAVPDESLQYHASRNDFSNWLKARTEFRLAARLRPRRISDYASTGDMRADLLRQLHEHRSFRQRGLFTEFSPQTFDPGFTFARTGGGSVGGKARGLAFINSLLSGGGIAGRYRGLEIDVPPAIVIGTAVFDEFLDMNDLRTFALDGHSDEAILRRFVGATRFPASCARDLAQFLELCTGPLAVRSSSLLEDAQFHPFAGVYQTCMIPNAGDAATRLRELLTAIRRVYASTFFHAAREYVKVTSLHVDDEKMAVIVQQMVGARHGDRFYPEISGVARSWNFYPAGSQRPDEGIASVALGLGKTIVEGGVTVRFCPRYPDNLAQFFSPDDAIRHHQRTFYALDMSGRAIDDCDVTDERIVAFPLSAAEEDGTLHWVASTYSADNDAVYEGIGRPGARVVTFAPILRNRLVPLAAAIDFLNELGSWGIGAPVEMEFALDLSHAAAGRARLAVLQMRPLVLSREADEATFDEIPLCDLLCGSSQVLGHGAIRDLRDLVVVDGATFERSKSVEAAAAVARINDRLVDEGTGYLLIGPGRWGSLDPLLGIPVRWDQICGARAIVEAGFRDLSIDPSQGSHFFQNLTAFQVGYFTVNPRVRNTFIDWDWLAAQPATEEGHFVRHIRLERGVDVKMNGRERRGVIVKGRAGI